MSRSLSFTVHPAQTEAEYLTVSDAMRQILDLVEVLERTETLNGGGRRIVWRLTEAHTNSPPFTVTAEAFPVDPVISIGLEASRLTDLVGSALQELLSGQFVSWIDHSIATPLRRVLQRNTHGIGRTEIIFDGADDVSILPDTAQLAYLTLEQIDSVPQVVQVDYARTEYGTVEVEIHSISRWNEKPALIAIERLSRDKVTCVLTQTLADELEGHRWGEAWDGRRLIIGGALHYDRSGSLKRVAAETAEEMPWTDVPLSDLQDIDLLQGRSVAEHLEHLRGEDLG